LWPKHVLNINSPMESTFVFFSYFTVISKYTKIIKSIQSKLVIFFAVYWVKFTKKTLKRKKFFREAVLVVCKICVANKRVIEKAVLLKMRQKDGKTFNLT
jgi:hypothetical protein